MIIHNNQGNNGLANDSLFQGPWMLDQGHFFIYSSSSSSSSSSVNGRCDPPAKQKYRAHVYIQETTEDMAVLVSCTTSTQNRVPYLFFFFGLFPPSSFCHIQET